MTSRSYLLSLLCFLSCYSLKAQCKNNFPLIDENKISFYNYKGALTKGPYTLATLDEYQNYKTIYNDYGTTGYSAFSFPMRVYIGKKSAAIDSIGELITPLLTDTIVQLRADEGKIKFMMVQNGLKYGLCNGKGEMICPTIYSSIEESYDCFVVTTKDYMGLLDVSGNWLLDTSYASLDHLMFDNRNWFVFKKNGISGVYDVANRKVLLTSNYDDISEVSIFSKTPYLKISEDYFYGVLDSNMKLILPPIYHSIETVNEEMIYASRNQKGGLHSLQTGKLIGDSLYQSINPYNYLDKWMPYYVVSANEKSGIMDSTGKVILKPLYYSIHSDGVIAENYNKLGIYNLTTGMLIKPNYTDIRTIEYKKKTYYLCTTSKGSAVIDEKGKTIYKSNSDQINSFHWNRYVVSGPEGKPSVFDLQTEKKLSIKATSIIDADSIWFNYESNGHYGLYNLINPKRSFQPIFEQLYPTPYGWLNKLKGKWGLMDKNGKEILPATFDSIQPNDEQYYFSYRPNKGFENYTVGYDSKILVAQQNGKWGIVDDSSKTICPFYFDDLTPVGYNILEGHLNGQLVYINQKGNNLRPTNLDTSIHCISYSILDSSFVIEQNGFYGRCRLNGKITIQPIYESVDIFDGLGLAQVTQNKKTGVIDKFGKTIIPCIYDYMGWFDENGVAEFRKGKLRGSIHASGKILMQTTNPYISNFSNCSGTIYLQGKPVAYVDSTGNYIAKVNAKDLTLQNGGYVDSTICIYDKLESFTNQGNDWDYSFSLPTCFYELKNLKNIYLWNTDFYGFSAEIKNLQNLESFSINSKTFSTLPPEIGSLKSLKNIDITTSLGLTIPSEIGQLPNLTSLYLNTYNELILPQEIGNLSKLKNLQLILSLPTELPAEIGKLKNLQRLSISLPDTMRVPSFLSHLSSLRYLNVAATSDCILPIEIGNFRKLDTLIVNGHVAFPEEIANIPTINYVSIENSDIPEKMNAVNFDYNCLVLDSNIQNWTSIKYLRINFTSYEYDNIPWNSLFEMLQALPNLATLSLENLYFDDFLQENFLSYLGTSQPILQEMKSLKSIILPATCFPLHPDFLELLPNIEFISAQASDQW